VRFVYGFEGKIKNNTETKIKNYLKQDPLLGWLLVRGTRNFLEKPDELHKKPLLFSHWIQTRKILKQRGNLENLQVLQIIEEKLESIEEELRKNFDTIKDFPIQRFSKLSLYFNERVALSIPAQQFSELSDEMVVFWKTNQPTEEIGHYPKNFKGEVRRWWTAIKQWMKKADHEVLKAQEDNKRKNSNEILVQNIFMLQLKQFYLRSNGFPLSSVVPCHQQRPESIHQNTFQFSKRNYIQIPNNFEGLKQPLQFFFHNAMAGYSPQVSDQRPLHFQDFPVAKQMVEPLHGDQGFKLTSLSEQNENGLMNQNEAISPTESQDPHSEIQLEDSTNETDSVEYLSNKRKNPYIDGCNFDEEKGSCFSDINREYYWAQKENRVVNFLEKNSQSFGFDQELNCFVQFPNNFPKSKGDLHYSFI